MTPGWVNIANGLATSRSRRRPLHARAAVVAAILSTLLWLAIIAVAIAR
jgi:hypothetical protein